MSVYTVTFSPTGGTKKAADRLAAAFGPEVQEIDLTARETDYSRFSFGDGDICVVAVPSYGGRVPAAAVSRLAQMNGTGANAVLMAVYGNRAYEDTLSELKDVLVRAGFRCIAAVAAVAEHSVMRQFASGRPNQEDLETLGEFGRRIKEALAQNPEGTAVALPLARDGSSKGRAFLAGSMSAIVEPVFGVLAALLAAHTLRLMPLLLAMAAGAMIYVVVQELIPEAHLDDEDKSGTLGFVVGFIIMMILDIALG